MALAVAEAAVAEAVGSFLNKLIKCIRVLSKNLVFFSLHNSLKSR